MDQGQSWTISDKADTVPQCSRDTIVIVRYDAHASHWSVIRQYVKLQVIYNNTQSDSMTLGRVYQGRSACRCVYLIHSEVSIAKAANNDYSCEL